MSMRPRKDWQWWRLGESWDTSSACASGSTAPRQRLVTSLDLGKVRHMEVQFLWAQEALRRKLFEICKITGERNPADVLTKEMSMVEMKEKIESIGGFLSVAETSRVHDDVGAIVKKIRWADVSDDDRASDFARRRGVAMRHKHCPCATWKRCSISSGEDTQAVVRLHRGTLCKGSGRT